MLLVNLREAREEIDRSRITMVHGHVWTNEGRTYLFAYHPASAMRFPDAGEAMHEDLRILKRLVRSIAR